MNGQTVFPWWIMLALGIVAGCAGSRPEDHPLLQDLEPGTYALFVTNYGDFVARLFTDRAPRTAENFIGLAEGTRPWIDPVSKKEMRKPFYDGLTFHRVIDGFMIQGGDPLKTGRGGPGYEFEDEFHPELRHDRAGILSMANSGPNTNGSQFFITLSPQPHLDDVHSVFGEVVRGMESVQRIAKVPTRYERPIKDVVMKRVTIHRIGQAASANEPGGEE